MIFLLQPLTFNKIDISLKFILMSDRCRKVKRLRVRWKPEPRRLLTEEEYQREAEEETQRALNELRKQCHSPEFSPWRTVSKIQSPKRCQHYIMLYSFINFLKLNLFYRVIQAQPRSWFNRNRKIHWTYSNRTNSSILVPLICQIKQNEDPWFIPGETVKAQFLYVIIKTLMSSMWVLLINDTCLFIHVCCWYSAPQVCWFHWGVSPPVAQRGVRPRSGVRLRWIVFRGWILWHWRRGGRRRPDASYGSRVRREASSVLELFECKNNHRHRCLSGSCSDKRFPAASVQTSMYCTVEDGWSSLHRSHLDPQSRAEQCSLSACGCLIASKPVH